MASIESIEALLMQARIDRAEWANNLVKATTLEKELGHDRKHYQYLAHENGCKIEMFGGANAKVPKNREAEFETCKSQANRKRNELDGKRAGARQEMAIAQKRIDELDAEINSLSTQLENALSADNSIKASEAYERETLANMGISISQLKDREETQRQVELKNAETAAVLKLEKEKAKTPVFIAAGVAVIALLSFFLYKRLKK